MDGTSHQFPRRNRIARAEVSSHRDSTGDEHTSYVPLSHLRCFAQPLLAAREMYPWHQTEPGGEVAATSDVVHRRREGLDHKDTDGRHTGHGLQLSRHGGLLGQDRRVNCIWDIAPIGCRHLNQSRGKSNDVTSSIARPSRADIYPASMISMTCRACSAVARDGMPSRTHRTSCITSSKT